MQHRQLPEELRQRVREYNQCKWIATRGVDEESLLKSLPTDLHRDIKRFLCLNLVKKVLNARMNFVIPWFIVVSRKQKHVPEFLNLGNGNTNYL